MTEYCHRCGWRGTWEQLGHNPRLGYRRCPNCEARGYDYVTQTVDPSESSASIRAGRRAEADKVLNDLSS